MPWSVVKKAGREIEGPEDIPEKDVWISVTMFVLLLFRYGRACGGG